MAGPSATAYAHAEDHEGGGGWALDRPDQDSDDEADSAVDHQEASALRSESARSWAQTDTSSAAAAALPPEQDAGHLYVSQPPGESDDTGDTEEFGQDLDAVFSSGQADA